MSGQRGYYVPTDIPDNQSDSRSGEVWSVVDPSHYWVSGFAEVPQRAHYSGPDELQIGQRVRGKWSADLWAWEIQAVGAALDADPGGGNPDGSGACVNTGTPALVFGTYEGNGTSQDIDLGFTPDAVWVKGTGGDEAVIRASGMPAALQFFPVGTPTGDLTLGSGQFSVGSDAKVNANGETYYYGAVRGGGDPIYVCHYEGTGSAMTVEGIPFTPSMVWIFPDNGTPPLLRMPTASSNQTQTWEGTEGFGNVPDLIPTSDGFEISTSALGVTYTFIAWREVAGFMQGVTYAGDGSDDRLLGGAGFTPDFAMVKSKTGVALPVVFRFPDNVGDESARVSSGSFIANQIQDFHSDGVELGTANSVNTTFLSSTYNAVFMKAVTVFDEELTDPLGQLDATEITYTPSDSDDWSGDDPTTVQEALDRIAAVVASEHGPIP